MPDLTTHAHFQCIDNEYWSAQVKDYVVKWDSVSHKNRDDVQYDYSCSCKAYQFGGGRHCKHIKQVIEEKRRCEWNDEFHEEVAGEPGDRKCPRCGKDVVAYKVAV